MGGWRPRWHRALVLVCVVVVLAPLALSNAAVVPPLMPALTALLGGTDFVLSVSAVLQPDSYADSDFWR